MARKFFDKRSKMTIALDRIPDGEDNSNYAAVDAPMPTCCRHNLYDWAICYQVPGDLGNITKGMPYDCTECQR